MDTEQTAPTITVHIQDAYSWRASYSDGDSLDEAHAAGGFASVDQSRITSLDLIAGESALYGVDIPGGAHAVFFRRRSLVLNLADESSAPMGTVHCIGWKRSEHDAVYLFVRPDSSTLLSSDLQAV